MAIDIKLALDGPISRKAAQQLRSQGFEVVFHARHEADEVWVPAALNKGANVFVSSDLDIPNLLDKEDTNAIWIDMPQFIGGVDQAGYIISQIIKIRKREAITGKDYKMIQVGKYTYVVEYSLLDQFLLAMDHNSRLQLSHHAVKGNSASMGGQK